MAYLIMQNRDMRHFMKDDVQPQKNSASLSPPSKQKLLLGKRSFFSKIKAALSLGQESCS